MSNSRKLRRNLQVPNVRVAVTLEHIVAANGGDFQFVKNNWIEAFNKAFPMQQTKEVYEPKQSA